MLKQRILTALALLAVLVPAVFYPVVWPFGVVTLLLLGAAAWEWSRLNGYASGVALLHALLFVAVASALWWYGWLALPLHNVWLLVGTLWVLLGAWLLRFGRTRWAGIAPRVRLLGGLLALFVAWAAIMVARTTGINFLFSALTLVWLADIGAYIAGRSIGGRVFNNKLAPSISPGKTWEGVLGGLVLVLAFAYGWTQFEQHAAWGAPSLYLRLVAHGWWVFVVGVSFLVAMSVVGDLVESLFKRVAGVKDSSALLPGHGGVLDRVDALLPTLPLAMMLTTFGG